MRRVKRKMTKAEKLNRQIESWERKQEDAVIMLRRSAEELLTLRRKLRRLLERETKKAMTARDVVWPSGEPVKSGDIEPGSTLEIELDTNTVVGVEPPKLDEDIPTFLQRGLAAQKAVDDITARAEIEAQQAAEKKRKAERAAERRAIKKETIDAELTGKRRAMPLTGKDALAAITAREDQTARMEALGFRKTGRRK
jgi:hypothetical protein